MDFTERITNVALYNLHKVQQTHMKEIMRVYQLYFPRNLPA